MRLAAEAAKEAAKEEEFHLRQNIGRAQRRLDESRAQAIDVLIQAVHLHDSHPIAEAAFRPHTVLDSLRTDELQALMPEVELFRVRRVEETARGGLGGMSRARRRRRPRAVLRVQRRSRRIRNAPRRTWTSRMSITRSSGGAPYS